VRLSLLHAPTLRTAPSDTDSAGFQLLVQAGFVRRAGAGGYAWLPLGVKVLDNVCAVVREEMRRAGAQELLMPVLGPAHEEALLDLLGGEIRSYRQLPLCFFHIHTGFRDETRPRSEAMAGRESLVWHACSFDRDEEGLDSTYRRMTAAIGVVFGRVGLDARPALADPGATGGDIAHKFVIQSASGRTRLVACPKCGYLADVEAAGCGARDGEAFQDAGRGPQPGPADGTRPGPGPELVQTPGMHTVEAVAAYLGITPGALIKTLIVLLPDGTPAAGLVRGDHELSLRKLARALGVTRVALADAATVERVSRAPVGFAGPVGLGGIPLIADYAAAAMPAAVTGANEPDAHLTGVRPGQDFSIGLAADIREIARGDPCPVCGVPLEPRTGIEVARASKLGPVRSTGGSAQFAAEDGTLRPVVMGSYGIDIGQTVAAVVEQHHDADGICWPAGVAPYMAVVLPVNDRDPAQVEAAERIYQELCSLGVETVIDDRRERAGVKFKDADLQGWPLRVTAGPRALAQGQVELRERATGRERLVPLNEAAAEVAALAGSRGMTSSGGR